MERKVVATASRTFSAYALLAATKTITHYYWGEALVQLQAEWP